MTDSVVTMKPVPITEQTFEAAMSNLETAYQMLTLFDYAGLVAARRHADSVLHITDPTKYRDLINSKNVADTVELADAAADFLARVKTVAENR